MRKKVDARIRTLIENGVKTKHRTMMVIVGDKGRDQVINLHYILSKCQVKARPSVLWCYKKDLGFTTHRKKRMKEIKKQISKGVRSADEDDPFELFIASTDIKYTYYKDSHKVLGNTFGMLVLQDFEAMTPNLLARTVETVEGGGLIIFLLKSVDSLQQLYTMTMDVHSRFRTEAHKDVVGRFNERFILSLGNCNNCIVVDDTLNVLPISSKIANIVPIEKKNTLEEIQEAELKNIKESVKDTGPVGTIVNVAKTVEQAKAVLTFVEAISEKTLRSTVALTAARGRGKSAALGLAISGAVAFGYSNIFVTSPTPENLKTLFDFIFKGFDALGFKEHLDYELIESTNPDFNKAIVRVNIFRTHRQTIQYIHPEDFQKLGQAELLVIDEAAAIPLPIVKNMMGPYLVFMSSTVNGYEGTGRSLSLKLIAQLRQQSSGQASASGRMLREIELKDPIRYASGDHIEKWLNELLCLDASNIPRIPSGYPAPQQCELYYVNRDTLFSFHKSSESFLQRMVGLFVSSHYKNAPDDLLLMSDAPAHHLFVLLGPVDEKQSTLPEILCAVQVCLEGQISKQSVVNSLSQGKAASGDLIPWTVSQQFQDQEFPSLSGARVVRIATNPEYQKMGYGSRALELLETYYQGEITNLNEDEEDEESQNKIENGASGNLLTEDVKPRKNLPPLLVPLKERRAERLHYLGVSFGVTPSLFNFWKKAKYVPVYIRQTPNEITGEHTCIMIHSLKADDLEVTCDPNWIATYYNDFKKRFLSLLSYNFRKFACSLAIAIVDPKKNDEEEKDTLSRQELDTFLGPFDLKRLEGYSNNLVDYHVIMDMMPNIAKLFFLNKTPFNLSPGQAAILLGLGLQHKTIDDIAVELTLPVNQVMALYNKSIRKFTQLFRGIREKEVAKSLPMSTQHVSLRPTDKSLDEDLEESAAGIRSEMEEETRKLLSDPSLKRFAVGGTDADWDAATKNGKAPPSAVSINSSDKKRKFNNNNTNFEQSKPQHNNNKNKKPFKKGKN